MYGSKGSTPAQYFVWSLQGEVAQSLVPQSQVLLGMWGPICPLGKWLFTPYLYVLRYGLFLGVTPYLL